MKKPHILFFLLVAVLAVMYQSCKKDKDAQVSENQSVDYLEDGDEEFLSSIPSENVDFKTIILPNGENAYEYLQQNDPAFLNANHFKTTDAIANSGPQAKRNLFIDRMVLIGFNLTNRSLHKENNQNGLAYSWGSKTLDLQIPPGNNPKATCQEKIVGLDCSGLVYQAVLSAGLGFSREQGGPNAQRLRDTTEWNNLLLKNSEFSKIRMEDLGKISENEMQTGDIVYWLKSDGKTAKHIGIIAGGSDGQYVIQSNGDAGNDCDIVKSVKKGPRLVKLSTIVNKWKGMKSYGIVRMVTDISGKWDMSFRCIGQTTNAIKLELLIPNVKGGKFTATGNGFDYDNTPLSATLDGNYDKKGNILNGTISWQFTSGSDNRTDAFSKKLDMDETGYFGLSKVVDNGGCYGEANLVNKEK